MPSVGRANSCRIPSSYKERKKLSSMKAAVRPRTSVILVNWNRKALLEKCLRSLAEQTDSDFELVLVDNGSTDGSLACLDPLSFPSLTVIRNNTNYGFGRAVNQGIRAARGRFIALVNNDVLLDRSWLEEVIRGFDLSPRTGMCASKILLAETPNLIDKVGHVIYGDGQNYGRGHGQPDRGQYDHVEEVLFPDGAAAIYRAEVFESAGLFDEDFFAYGDDAELGLRVRLCGWKCYFIPLALAYHYHSATLGSYAPEKIYLIERNRIWLALKLFPGRQLAQVPFYSAIRYLYSLWALVTSRGHVGECARQGLAWAMFRAVLRAHGAALRGIPQMVRKRREIFRRARISKGDFLRLIRLHSITARELTLSG